MTRLVFADCETTGLNRDIHEMWELALIVRDPDWEEEGDAEITFQFPVNIANADPMALNINKFYERYDFENNHYKFQEGKWRGQCYNIAKALVGSHLVANVPDFDQFFITKTLRLHGLMPTHHYHIVDVEALIAGFLKQPPPWDSKELSRAVGINPATYERHTALGDARWTRDLYDRVMQWAKYTDAKEI